tara:strand:- start:288 stop:1100 length:813 start_codon:yes stop_codon:yes gene_type:complete
MKKISLNFGAIKDTVYKLSCKEIVSESNENSKRENSLTKFIKKLKEEPLLKVQYMIFENLTKGHFESERLAERYINENMSLAEKLDWNKLLDVNKTLRKEILDEHFVQGSDGFEDLYEAIHTLIESRSNLGYSDVNKSHDSYETILSHLQRDISETSRNEEETHDMPKFLSWRYVNEHAVSNFNKRYRHLSDSDKKTFKVLVSSDDVKIKYAKELKEESMSLVENAIIEEGEEFLSNFKSKLNSIKNINPENVDEIIINCSELNESLSKK